MKRTVNKMTFIQDYKTTQGLMAIDESTMELTQFSSKLLPVICFNEDTWVSLNQSVPINFIIGHSNLLYIEEDRNGVPKHVYLADLTNVLQTGKMIQEDDILNIVKTVNGHSLSLVGKDREDYINQQIQDQSKPSMIAFVAKNLIIEVVDSDHFTFSLKQ